MLKQIKVKDAAKIMGKSEQYVRIGLQRKLLPFGSAVKMGRHNYTYHISPYLFEQYMGSIDFESGYDELDPDKGKELKKFYFVYGPIETIKNAFAGGYTIVEAESIDEAKRKHIKKYGMAAYGHGRWKACFSEEGFEEFYPDKLVYGMGCYGTLL